MFNAAGIIPFSQQLHGNNGHTYMSQGIYCTILIAKPYNSILNINFKAGVLGSFSCGGESTNTHHKQLWKKALSQDLQPDANTMESYFDGKWIPEFNGKTCASSPWVGIWDAGF